MMNTHATDAIRSEGRLLFALLDAVQDQGLMSDASLEERWTSLKARIVATEHYEATAEYCYELFLSIERAGLIAGTWIEPRWRGLRGRVSTCSTD